MRGLFPGPIASQNPWYCQSRGLTLPSTLRFLTYALQGQLMPNMRAPPGPIFHTYKSQDEGE